MLGIFEAAGNWSAGEQRNVCKSLKHNPLGIGLYSSKTPQKMPKNDDFEQAIFLVFLSAKVEID